MRVGFWYHAVQRYRWITDSSAKRAQYKCWNPRIPTIFDCSSGKKPEEAANSKLTGIGLAPESDEDAEIVVTTFPSWPLLDAAELNCAFPASFIPDQARLQTGD